jgi:hypothetical protein
MVLIALVTLSHRAGTSFPRISPVPALAVRRTAAIPNKSSFHREPISPAKKRPLRSIIPRQQPVAPIDRQEDANEYASADQPPPVISISVARIVPPVPTQSKAEQLLTGALTDPKSSASEVKARIQKALTANESALAKNRLALDAYLKAIGNLPASAGQLSDPGDQQSGGDLQRRLLEEKAQYQQQEIILQQELRILLERAAKKLSIVYI